MKKPKGHSLQPPPEFATACLPGRHALHTVLRRGALRPCGHTVHDVFLLCLAENESCGQSWHSTLPASG